MEKSPGLQHELSSVEAHSTAIGCIGEHNGYIFTGSFDRSVKCWQIDKIGEPPKCIQIYHGHRRAVVAIGFHEDYILTGSHDKTCRMWHVVTGKLQHSFRGHDDAVIGISVHGTTMHSASWDGSLRAWNTVTGACLRVMYGHQGAVSALFAHEGVLFTASDDRSVCMWNVETGEVTRKFSDHPDTVTAIVVHDHAFLFSACRNNVIFMWNIASGQVLKTLVGHTQPVVTLTFGDGLLYSGSYDKSVRAWSVKTGICVSCSDDLDEAVVCVRYSDKHHKLLTGSRNGQLKFWDLRNTVCANMLEAHTAAVRCLTAEGGILVSAGDDHTAVAYDVRSRRQLMTFSGHTQPITSVVARGTSVWTGSLDSTVRMWSVETTECTAIFETPAAVLSLAVQGSIVFAGLQNTVVIAFDLTTGRIKHSFPSLYAPVHVMQFYKFLLYTVALDTLVKVWDVKTFDCVREYRSTEHVSCLAHSDEMLILGSFENNITVYHLNGEKLGVLSGHTGPLLALSTAKHLLYSSSDDCTIRCWDLKTRQCIGLFTGHASPAVCVLAFGDVVFSTESDKLLQWTLKAMQLYTLMLTDADDETLVEAVRSEEHGTLIIDDARALSAMADSYTGRTILHCAAAVGADKLLLTLLDVIRIQLGNEGVVSGLLQTDLSGRTVLEEMLHHGREQLLMQLIDRFDVPVGYRIEGQTLLFLLATCGWPGVDRSDLLLLSPRGVHYHDFFIIEASERCRPLYGNPSDQTQATDEESSFYEYDNPDNGVLTRDEMTDLMLYAFLHARTMLLQHLFSFVEVAELFNTDELFDVRTLLTLAADLLNAAVYDALDLLAPQFSRLLDPAGVGSLLHVACQLSDVDPTVAVLTPHTTPDSAVLPYNEFASTAPPAADGSLPRTAASELRKQQTTHNFHDQLNKIRPYSKFAVNKQALAVQQSVQQKPQTTHASEGLRELARLDSSASLDGGVPQTQTTTAPMTQVAPMPVTVAAQSP
eukprot:TRINITY_DN133_c0_g1_i1.p1 TRINITY_DN133_c0_g1~~TRINITY_DN133_c0_g1_i1.p1  ORF type:complete len:987 (-),score=233.02 TRINITY_DN133_c0_g1_i1:204-3164(-)